MTGICDDRVRKLFIDNCETTVLAGGRLSSARTLEGGIGLSAGRRENFALSLIFAILGVVVICNANQIPAGGALGRGADFLPKIIGWSVLFCALCYFVQGIAVKGGAQPQEQPGDQSGDYPGTPPEDQPLLSQGSRLNGSLRSNVKAEAMLRFGASFGLLLFYALLLSRLGFVITSTIYIYAQSQFMVPSEKRSHLLSAVIAVASSVALYLVFVYVLRVNLPSGVMPRLF